MIKTYFLIFLSSISLLSCTKENTAQYETPVAIQTLIDSYSANGNCTCEPIINQYNWKGQIVYVLASRGPACNSVPIIYDKDGKMLLAADYNSYTTFRKESKLIREVWSCR